jgi:CubicO group peptidase (beta-lactamase class C family)
MGIRHRLRSGFLVLALATVGCYPSAAPRGLTDGIWAGKTDDRQFAIEFSGSHLAVHAMIHTMLDGRRVTERFAFDVRFEPPRIEIVFDGDLSYTGKVDLERGRIDGEIHGLAVAPSELVLRRVAPSAVAGFLARPMSGSLAPRYHWSRPVETDDGWRSASPAEVGLKQPDLEKTVTAIIDGEAGLIHSILIVRHGRLVVEEYFHGYGRDDLHDIGTCTLGVTSLLTGIAIDRGLIGSLANPIPDFFPRLEKAAASGWERVSVEHLLTMTSVRPKESGFSVKKLVVDEAFFSEVMSSEPHARPGTEWLYSDRHVNLLAGVLLSSTGTRADRFAETFLFGPLGIERYEWRPGVEGRSPRMHNGLRLRPRDLAKIGALVLGEGQWRDRRIVSTEWIVASTSAQVRSPGPDPEDYGYLWWVLRLPESGGGAPVFLVWGLGSQFLYVAPSLDSVFVLTGGNQFNDKSFVAPFVLADRLLAAYPPTERGARPD